MHKSGFVVAVKNDEDQILREFGGKVYLPFYSQYKFLLKNLRKERAVVSITVDGTSVLGDNKLVVGGNSSINLERFLNDNNLTSGKKFKFVPVEGNAVDPSSSENGWVEVCAQFEQDLAMITGAYFPPSYSVPYYIYYPPISTPFSPDIRNTFPFQQLYTTCGGVDTSMSINCASSQVMSSTLLVNNATPTHQKGVTLPGGESSQKFSSTSTSWLAPEVVTLRLQLLAPLVQSVTVDDTKYKHCTECGKKIKGNYKFCPKCGTRQID